MRYCEYVEISQDIIYSDLYSDKNILAIFMEILLNRDCDTNSLKVTWGELGKDFKILEDKTKKTLFKLKKMGYMELYMTDRKWKIIVALRKCEDLYKIGDFELFLDDSLIIDFPKSYSRNDKGYDKFRKAVLERDNYTCQLCSSKENLEVHHKKSYAKYVRLRTTVSNGITLCEKCHDKIHSKVVDIVE